MSSKIQFSRGPARVPYCVLLTSTAQQAPNLSQYPIVFDRYQVDTDQMSDLVNHPTRITIRTAGIYYVNAQITFYASTTGTIRQTGIRLNGAGAYSDTRGFVSAFSQGSPGFPAGINPAVVTSVDRLFLAGDYIENCAYQNSGGNLSLATLLDGNAEYQPRFSARWVGPYHGFTSRP